MENNGLDALKKILKDIRKEISIVIIGQHDVIDKALICIFSGQHALIEGVPGVAKTLLVRTLAKVMGCDFNRVQFTPDLMPTDITGTNIFNMKNDEFTLIKGPIFTTFLLADEINRTPAKTQSALLQAMQERNVTIDGTTHQLSQNFSVFATQNPIEYEGTYPLPEAQKDRFMLKITMGLPEKSEELDLTKRSLGSNSPEQLLEGDAVKTIISPDELIRLRTTFSQITIKEELIEYLVSLVRKTREHEGVLVGAGPRASQSLILSSRIFAALQERDFVTPDDIKEMSLPVLSHRLILRPELEIEGLTIPEVINNIVQEVAVPQ